MKHARCIITSFTLSHLLMTALAMTGCTEPIEPGSDLPAQAEPEILGTILSVNLEGDFDLVTTLPDADGGPGMTLPLTLEIAQQGEDSAMDMSTLTANIALFPGIDADTSSPASLNKYGLFEMSFETLSIPGALAGMEEDLELDITLKESQVVAGGDCIYGTFSFPVMTMGFTIPVESTYTAKRKGSTGGCVHPDEEQEMASENDDMGGTNP